MLGYATLTQPTWRQLRVAMRQSTIESPLPQILRPDRCEHYPQ